MGAARRVLDLHLRLRGRFGANAIGKLRRLFLGCRANQQVPPPTMHLEPFVLEAGSRDRAFREGTAGPLEPPTRAGRRVPPRSRGAAAPPLSPGRFREAAPRGPSTPPRQDASGPATSARSGPPRQPGRAPPARPRAPAPRWPRTGTSSARRGRRRPGRRAARVPRRRDRACAAARRASARAAGLRGRPRPAIPRPFAKVSHGRCKVSRPGTLCRKRRGPGAARQGRRERTMAESHGRDRGRSMAAPGAAGSGASFPDGPLASRPWPSPKRGC